MNPLPRGISILLAGLASGPVPAGGAEDAGQGEVLFALHVKGIIEETCIPCHSPEKEHKLKGELDLSTRKSILEGGESGEVLIVGNAAESLLYTATTWRDEDYEMPPKEADRLSEDEQGFIRDWINAGAPWPDSKRVDELREAHATGEVVETSGGLGEAWTKRRYKTEKLWAYRPLRVEVVPIGEHPVDWFVNRRLKDTGLVPAAPAEGKVMARRMSMGLTGLPADPDRTAAFVASYRKDPADAVVGFSEELMASPHYGEHFGRMWLDVVRYADSAGYANDYARPNAWRYRDYVVRSFNDDKPYNEFVLEQIAGDEFSPDDSEKLIATGFLRMGAWEQTAMSVSRETRQLWLDDVTDSVGQTFLAHPLQCAKCHDHKFDPIPTRDYYSMMAFFTTTQFAERDAPFLETENRSGFMAANRWTQQKVSAYAEQLKDLQAVVKRNRVQEDGEASVGDNGLDDGEEASMNRIKKNLKRHQWELDKTRPIAFSVYTGNTVDRKNVEARLPLPKNPWGQGEIEEDTILTGGNAFARGASVVPGPLSAAVHLGRMDGAPVPVGQEPRRRVLAEWLVDPKNPLTARVMVNRVWSWHFGQGLAGNPNNFGGSGKLPTHPELLDYLSDWFMRNGWSVKKLNALLVSSETYRRSTQHPDHEALDAKDPKHELYAIQQPRRLAAEELRDAMLAVSGELNREVGGVPARPDINLEVAMQPRQIMGGVASVYEPDPTPAQRNRRTLYAERIRGLRDPFLETFNQPGSDKSCELRETSTIAPQALTMINSEEVHERALAFASRLRALEMGQKETLVRAFELALGRAPTPGELQSCLAHWKAAGEEEADKHYEVRIHPGQIKRMAISEKTADPYEFVEILPSYRSYVPDLQPGQADADTRALAQVCLILFNLNEFAYLD